MRTLFQSVQQPAARPRRRSCGPVMGLLENRTLLSHGLAASLAVLLLGAVAAVHASSNGASAATQIPAFYDDNQVTINVFQLSAAASASLIGHNKSLNTIFAYADLDEEQPFNPVIDAIQGDGFNPHWQQVLIQFNPGFTPEQFTSEEDVLAAALTGEITLVTTDEVYICAVVKGTGH